MKTKLISLIVLALFVSILGSCDKIEELGYVKVVLGAQENTSDDGFYAAGEDKTYTMAEAADNQALIDIFCFFEGGDSGNNIALASPGTGITGIFTGEDAPDTWTTKNTTRFFKTALTEEQFTAIQEDDDLIISTYDAANSYRKAKDLQVGQVWSFLTADNIYGMLYVSKVTQGATGGVVFFLKTKEAPTE